MYRSSWAGNSPYIPSAGSEVIDRPIKLTNTQVRILSNLKNGRDPTYGCHGMSQHGGWDRSLASLRRKKLVSWTGGYKLTEEGEIALKNSSL